MCGSFNEQKDDLLVKYRITMYTTISNREFVRFDLYPFHLCNCSEDVKSNHMS